MKISMNRRMGRAGAVGVVAGVFVMAYGAAAFAATIYGPTTVTPVISGQKFELQSGLSTNATSNVMTASTSLETRAGVATNRMGVMARLYSSSGKLLIFHGMYYNQAPYSPGAALQTQVTYTGTNGSSYYSKGLVSIWSSDSQSWINYSTLQTPSATV